MVAPLIDQLIANAIESRTLATLRDTLLPKLLSGELSAGAALGQSTECMVSMQGGMDTMDGMDKVDARATK